MLTALPRSCGVCSDDRTSSTEGSNSKSSPPTRHRRSHWNVTRCGVICGPTSGPLLPLELPWTGAESVERRSVTICVAEVASSSRCNICPPLFCNVSHAMTQHWDHPGAEVSFSAFCLSPAPSTSTPAPSPAKSRAKLDGSVFAGGAVVPGLFRA